MKRVGWSLLHNDLEIRDTGRYGMGVFATRLISAGEILCVMGGQVADTSLENAASPLSTRYNIDFSEECSFCPLEESQVPLMPQLLFNHSCRPNIGFADSQTLIAIEPIPGGGECCYDYAFCMWSSEQSVSHFSMPCQCGQPECRGVICETDWMRTELQKRYGQWFMPFLRRKMNPTFHREGEAPSEPIIVGSHGGSPSHISQ
ncbi:MAG: SET domain-containing protein-lysine N-methyltransferase [Verrucomicrobiota bacterium]